MAKRVFFIFVAVILIIAGIVVYNDAKKIYGLKLTKLSDIKYQAGLENVGNSVFFVKYVPKENIYPLFGEAINELGNKIALVRDDLPMDVQDFVLRHELYHLQDGKYKNVITREIHATLAAIPYQPIGFIKTVFLSLTNEDRLNYYFRLVF